MRLKLLMPIVIVAGCLPVVTPAAEAIKPKVADALAFAPPGNVTFTGWIGEEIQTCLKGRIHGQIISDLISPFAMREEDRLWREEFWGKWYTSATLAYRYQADPKLRAIVDEAVRALLATQTPDGAITTYKQASEFSHWDTWGRKYTLLGLLAYHDLTGDTKTLAAACRHADCVLAHFGPGKADIATNGYWNGMAASSILEPMVLLYRATGEARYLQFAEYIVKSWEGPQGPDLVRKALAGTTVFKMFGGPDPKQKGYGSGGKSKAYEMMSCYEGLIELHRITGEPRHLEAARKVFADIRDTEITIIGSGSSWERWCNGRVRQGEQVPEWMETCVTVTWIKFAAQLLRMTGDASYADEIERSAYNPLLAAQKDDGTWWSHYNPLEGPRGPAPEQCKMHANCCVENGPRGLLLLPALACMSGSAGPVVNFYEPATAKLPLPNGGSVGLEIKSDYPRANTVEINVAPDKPAEFAVSLRLPAWSRATLVSVNGQPISGLPAGVYARIARTWQSGDVIKLTLDFSVRCEKEPGQSGRVAITRGPIVFTADKRVSLSGFIGEGKVVAKADGTVEALAVQGGLPAGIRMALDVPFVVDGKPALVRLCDYASAGHTWGEDSTLRVWLPQPLNLANPFAGLPPPSKKH